MCEANSQETHTHTHKCAAAATFFLQLSAKKEGLSSRKTSIIFNNYTYLQRCNEAKMKRIQPALCQRKIMDKVHSFLDQDSFFEMSEWPSLLCNVASGSPSSSLGPSRKPGVHVHQIT